MALGSHVPEWKALQLELRALAIHCSAHLAAVSSTGNVLWCASRTDDDVDQLADAFYLAVIAPRRQTLKRGTRIDIVRRDDDNVCVARSFAAIYVLVVWISRFGVEGKRDMSRLSLVGSRFVDDDAVRTAMTKRLPRIETLTVSLPSPDPEPAEGVGKARA